MQEARAESEHGGDLQMVAEMLAHGLQRLNVRLVAIEIGEQAEVIAGARAPEVGTQPGFQGRRAGGLGQRRGVGRIGVEGEAVALQDGGFGGALAALLVGLGESAGLDLAGLDVGLIEGIDADDGAGHGDGDLPAEELLEQHLSIGQGDADHRLAGLLEVAGRLVAGDVILAVQAQIGEQAIGAVHGRMAERFGVDGNEALALLAGGFGQELFEPGADIAD